MTSETVVQIVMLVTGVILACVPIFALAFKWSKDTENQIIAQITKLAAALAPLLGLLIGGGLLLNHNVQQRKANIEAVKTLKDVSPEHKEERAAMMGLKKP